MNESLKQFSPHVVDIANSLHRQSTEGPEDHVAVFLERGPKVVAPRAPLVISGRGPYNIRLIE